MRRIYKKYFSKQMFCDLIYMSNEMSGCKTRQHIVVKLDNTWV